MYNNAIPKALQCPNSGSSLLIENYAVGRVVCPTCGREAKCKLEFSSGRGEAVVRFPNHSFNAKWRNKKWDI
jgi:uncharacterized Zn finger protein (UPF0148 family)